MQRPQKISKDSWQCEGMLETKSSKWACSITELETERKDGAQDLLEKILDRNNLNQAYLKVVRNKGAAGIDGMTVDEMLPLKEHKLRCFLFMRFFLKYLNFGEQIFRQKLSLKKLPKSSREMTTALFLLRCVETGVSISELNLLTIGMVLDICTEKANDGVKYSKVAGQAEFDKF